MHKLKSLIDIIISAVGIIILVPLSILIVIAIKLDSSGPAFFRQKRIGKKGQPFNVFKFRTMVEGAEKKGAGFFVKEGDSRITRVGNYLRRTSLDELPQLINILKGEMSLIGPRPTLPYQVEKYDQDQRRRLLMKPGVTGWAQVNGRSALTWPERIELDLWYIDNWSMWLDIKILFKTFLVVFSRQGLYRTIEDDPIAGNRKDKS